MFTLSDPIKNPFNDWLKSNSIYVAIGVAVILAIVILSITLINKKNSK